MPLDSISSISTFYNTVGEQNLASAIKRLCKNEFLAHQLDKMPTPEIVSISKKFNEAPDMYEEALTGNIKFVVTDFTNQAFPVFSDENHIQEILNPNSLISKTIELFTKGGSKEDPIKRIFISNKYGRCFTSGFNKKGQSRLNLGPQDIDYPKGSKIEEALFYTNNHEIELIRG